MQWHPPDPPACQSGFPCPAANNPVNSCEQPPDNWVEVHIPVVSAKAPPTPRAIMPALFFPWNALPNNAEHGFFRVVHTMTVMSLRDLKRTTIHHPAHWVSVNVPESTRNQPN